jgi:Putative zinc-finger
MSSGHIGEYAALYALGALDDDERFEVDAHVRLCASCMQLLGSAERDVAIAASMEPQRSAPPQLKSRIDRTLGIRRRAVPLVAALAAAFVVGALPSAYFWQQNLTLHRAMITQTAAMNRMASAPHRMAPFRGMSEGGSASVMYAPDGSWYVIVVRNASRALQVAWMHDGEHTLLGTAEPLGDVAMLYVPNSHRMDRLALMDGEQIVAQAQLTY